MLQNNEQLFRKVASSSSDRTTGRFRGLVTYIVVYVSHGGTLVDRSEALLGNGNCAGFRPVPADFGG